jgi:hypothetical protein
VNGWLERMLNSVTVAAPQQASPRGTVIGPSPDVTVEAPPRFAWDEKRWRPVHEGNSTNLAGRFEVFDHRRETWRRFDGRLVQERYGIATYIADPPPELRRHRHGPCLQLVEVPWFRLHWRHAPSTLDDGLLYMERLLDEAINGRVR